jgi:fatty acid desaturase
MVDETQVVAVPSAEPNVKSNAQSGAVATAVSNAASNTGVPPSPGDEFRRDQRKSEAARLMPTELIAELSRINNALGAWAVFKVTFPILLLATAGLYFWGQWAIIAAIALLMAIYQHAFFVLAHDAAHYRLFSNRRANDIAGRFLGSFAGISMCTYRVVHRMHHNHLFTKQDPDIALNGGYPRGKAYLLKKLATDLTGITAYKTFSYFFGNPAKNTDTDKALKPLDDTSPKLRQDAKNDRMTVAAVQLGMPVFVGVAFGGQALAQYLVLWVLPIMTLLQAILRLRAVAEHGAPASLESPLTAARTNKPNWLTAWALFPCNVNYHIEHHLFPAVPHYHLPKLHQEMVARGVLQGAEVRSFADTWKRIYAPRAAA